MKEKLQNLPFVIKVILAFLITILFFVSVFLFMVVLEYFGLLLIFNIICGIIIITIFPLLFITLFLRIKTISYWLVPLSIV